MKKKSVILLLNIIIVAIFAAAYLGMMHYVEYVNKHSITLHVGDNNKECELTVEPSKSWSELSHGYNYGMQYDIVIKNLSKMTMKDWTVKLTVPLKVRIDSSWNGEFSKLNEEITITPTKDNCVIVAGETADFGMVIYTNTQENIGDASVTIYRNLKIYNLSVFWILTGFLFICFMVNVVKFVTDAKTKAINAQKDEYQNIVNQSFETFANIIDAKDEYTHGHSRRVAVYSRELAKRMGMDEDKQQKIYYIALLHDIGKIGTPDAILNKKGKLDDNEYNEIKKHVIVGGEILKDFTVIEGISDGAKYHHERYDGTGYAEGLKGEQIPLIGRIICVADYFDAMASNRCYREHIEVDEIVKEIEACSGTHFDPGIAKHMLDMINEGIAPIR